MQSNKHSRDRQLNVVLRKSHGSKQSFKIYSSIYTYLNRPSLKSQRSIYAPNLNTNLTLSWRRPLSCRTSPLICSANQWTGFYMIAASVMKELMENFIFCAMKRLIKKGKLRVHVQFWTMCIMLLHFWFLPFKKMPRKYM